MPFIWIMLFPLLFQEPQEVTKNGMTFRWKIEGDRLHCQVSAPCQGWVAVGFNTKESLVGSNLVMGAAINGTEMVEDHYIVGMGKHPKVEDLGGKSTLQHASCKETKDQTQLNFSLPLSSTDSHHHSLQPGNTYHLTMAYSHEDNFEHHSAMRTSITITL